ncbi:hypothetical protein [Microbacterium sp. P03]|uniref:hypothetical protein n=1 Tax=Microbacterium sp. P03 TaxID=3366946 RepID=UPI003745C136
MTSTPRRLLAICLTLGAAAAALSACATPTAGSPASSSPPTGDGTVVTELDAAWLDSGRAVAIITSGSSTCLPIADEPMYADGKLTVELTDPEAAACTQDLVPRASVVTLPEGVDPTKNLEIVVTGTYAGDTDLDGDASLTGIPGQPTDYLPSAGWFDDGAFVLLSWGSSTCVPVLESAEATGASEVTVTFQTPPADQICTADMAPRTTIIDVTGLEEDSGAQLVLSGGEFDDVTIPIAGS